MFYVATSEHIERLPAAHMSAQEVRSDWFGEIEILTSKVTE
jgi:hypothetical protein